MTYFLNVDSPVNYPGLFVPRHNSAMHLAVVAFSSFFDDTRQLVSDGVRKDIASRIADALTFEEREAHITRGKAREKSLKEWLAVELPLSYGNRASSETFSALVRAVCHSNSAIALGLPHFEQQAMTPSAFIDILLDMSSPISPTPPTAPVLPRGAFLPILFDVHSSLLHFSGKDHPSETRAYAADMLLRAAEHLRISFVPYVPVPPEGSRRGPRRKVPVFDAWSALSLPEKSVATNPLPSSSFDQPPSPTHRAAAVALSSAIACDSNVEWLANRITLADLTPVLRKARLPADFYVIPPSGAPYVSEAHTWVRANYDGRKPVHHLALIVSIIAAEFVPRLFMPEDLIHRFEHADTRDKVRQVYESIPWVTKPQRRGMAQKKIFIAMITSFLIALYEPQSPLRRRMKSSPRGGLGSPWTDKYSPFLLFFLFPSPHPFLLAAKGIAYTTLIRLGVLWGLGQQAYTTKGTFAGTWGCHTFAYMETLYNDVVRKLARKTPYRNFDAVAALIGQQNAYSFFHLRGLPCRAPPSAQSSTALPS
jgi:hypothetical protein